MFKANNKYTRTTILLIDKFYFLYRYHVLFNERGVLLKSRVFKACHVFNETLLCICEITKRSCSITSFFVPASMANSLSYGGLNIQTITCCFKSSLKKLALKKNTSHGVLF